MMRAPLRHVSAGWLLALGLSPLLSACGSGMDDLEQWVAEVKARKSTEIAPIPQIKAFEPFAYDPAAHRDPFLPVAPKRSGGDGGGAGPQPDFRRAREALEEYPLDALRMQGTIRTPRAVYALVKAPDGVIHRVGAGTHMGQNFGEIRSITDKDITLTELVPDGFGGWQQRPATLALAE